MEQQSDDLKTGSINSDTTQLDNYAHLRITMDANFVPPVPLVTINGGIVSTPGSITTVSGAPKSAKTAFCNVLIAGALSEDGFYDGFEGVDVLPNNRGKAVLHFDTEQSKHKQQKNLQVILKRLALSECPEYFLSYNLKDLDLREYKKTVSGIFRAAFEKFNGIHLAVIDGGADFILDVNDPAASTKLVRFFERLAAKYDVSLVLIIHTNPGSAKERGHLGSQLQRKGESVISVVKEGDTSYLVAKFLREAGNSDIPAIEIKFDKSKGYHVSCGVRSDSAFKRNEEAMIELATTVFEGGVAFNYNDAIIEIMKHSGKKERISKELFKELRALELITKTEDGKWHLMGQEQIADEQLFTGVKEDGQVQSAEAI